MIVVDSSVWVAHFNGADDPHARRLLRAFESEEDIAIVPIIVTEVLQGFRFDSGFESARRACFAS